LVDVKMPPQNPTIIIIEGAFWGGIFLKKESFKVKSRKMK